MSPYLRGDLRINDTNYVPPKGWAYTVSTTSSTAASPTCTGPTGYYSSTYITATVRESKEVIKKKLKRLMDRWCIDSWNDHVPHYAQPKLEPINLRGVRLDGRGWANL